MNSTVDDQGRRERLPWIALAVVALIAIGIVVAYYVASDAERAREAERAERNRAQAGVACSPLERAELALMKRERDEFKEAIKEAERQAIYALDSDEASFGKSERTALILAARDASELGGRAGILETLDAVKSECESQPK